ncbi:MAG TPA: tetratricopeptide repeat protein [Nitrososphaeraceae archaeon]|jgi:tetratricopeptide (TPR) repeat protein
MQFYALESFNKAIMITPDYAEAYYRKGQALVNLGKHQEAVKCFDEALRIQPLYNEAAKEKEAALEIQRQKESTLIIQEGQLHLKNGRYNSAIDSFTKAIDANPNYALAYTYKGDTLYKLQRYEEAIKYFDEALKLKPSDRKST